MTVTFISDFLGKLIQSDCHLLLPVISIYSLAEQHWDDDDYSWPFAGQLPVGCGLHFDQRTMKLKVEYNEAVGCVFQATIDNLVTKRKRVQDGFKAGICDQNEAAG